MKRILTAAVAVLLLFLVSCSASEAGDGPVFDTDFSVTGGTPDLEGFEFRIRFYANYSRGIDSFLGYKENSVLYDAAIKRLHETEDLLNCTVSFSSHSSANLEGEFNTVIMAGLYFRDAVMTESWDLRPIVESKVFEPLSCVNDFIDYTDSKKWGSWKILEQCVWDGDLYGVVPVQWPEFAVSTGYVFAFNEKYASVLGQPDPREYVDDGTWSRSRLGEMMTVYTTDSLANPLKAALIYPGHFYDSALRANNAQAYKLVNGEYVSGYHTEEGLDALDWAYSFLYSEYRDCIYPDPGPDDARHQVFIDGHIALLLNSIANIYGSTSAISYEVEDYCILPMPNGPEREKENAPYTTFIENVKNTLLFPLNGHVDASALVADTLFEPLEGFGQEEIRDYFLRYIVYDIRDYELLNEMFENNRYSFLSDGIRGNVVEKLYGGLSKSVSQLLDSTEERQNELVRLYVAPTVSSLESIFGAEALGH